MVVALHQPQGGGFQRHRVQGQPAITAVPPGGVRRQMAAPGVGVDEGAANAHRQPALGQLQFAVANREHALFPLLATAHDHTLRRLAQRYPILLTTGIGQRTLDAQRQDGGRRFVERLGQRRTDPLQIGLDHHRGIALADVDIRLPAGRTAQPVEQRPAEMLAHLLNRRRSGGLYPDPGPLAAHLHLEAATEGPPLDVAGLHATLGNLQAAIDLGQRRQPRHHLQLVVAEGIVGAQPGLGRTPQRQVEMQVERAVAAGLHAVGEAVDLVGHRALADEAEKIGGLPFGPPGHLEQLVVRLEIGNRDLYPGKAGTEDFAALGVDLHADAETHVGIDMVDQRPARRIVDPDVGRLGGNAEFTLRRVAEGKITQVALEHQATVVAATADDATADPVPGIGIDRVRHVAPDRLAVGAVDAGGKIDHTGTVAVVDIAAARRASGVRAGKVETVEGHFQPLLLALRAQAPVGSGLEQVERNFGHREHCRQRQGRLLRIKQQIATPLVQVDLPGETGRPREIRLGTQPQAVERGLQRIALQGFVVHGPARLQFGDAPLRTIGLQKAAGGRIERHVAGQLRQRPEVEETGAGPPLDRTAGSIVAPVETEVAGRDAQAVVSLQFDPLAGKRPLAGPVARLDPAAQAGQIEFRQFLRQTDAQLLKRQVGGQPTAAIAHFPPQTQGTAPVRQMHGVIDPALPAGQIGIVELNIEPRRQIGKLPRLQRLQQVALEFAAQVKAVGQRCRRHRRQPQTMAMAAIVEAEINVFQNQRRRLPLAVVPDQGRVADANPRLRQQPVESGGIAVALRLQAGNRNPPINRPPHMQHGIFKSQQGQLEPHPEQAFPGKHGLDPMQRKDRLPLAVGDRHPVEYQIRVESLPARFNPPDPDLQTNRLARGRLDFRLVSGDPGQHGIAQRKHQSDKQQPGNEQTPAQPAQTTVDRRPGQICPSAPDAPGKKRGLPGASRRRLLIHAHYSCVRLLCQKGS